MRFRKIREAVLSPVDGRIVVVERARDPYRDVDALKISIFYERVQRAFAKIACRLYGNESGL